MPTTGLDRMRQQREMMQDLSRLMRASIDNVDDAQGKALLEASAEVLGGLIRAFYHYEGVLEGDTEEAWAAEPAAAT